MRVLFSVFYSFFHWNLCVTLSLYRKSLLCHPLPPFLAKHFWFLWRYYQPFLGNSESLFSSTSWPKKFQIFFKFRLNSKNYFYNKFSFFLQKCPFFGKFVFARQKRVSVVFFHNSAPRQKLTCLFPSAFRAAQLDRAMWELPPQASHTIDLVPH